MTKKKDKLTILLDDIDMWYDKDGRLWGYTYKDYTQNDKPFSCIAMASSFIGGSILGIGIIFAMWLIR